MWTLPDPGHSFLLLLVTVRDAAARLPNGEGTRAEICELLKDSQFLAPDVTSTQVGLGPSQVKDCLQGSTNLVMCHGGGWWATYTQRYLGVVVGTNRPTFLVSVM